MQPLETNQSLNISYTSEIWSQIKGGILAVQKEMPVWTSCDTDHFFSHNNNLDFWSFGSLTWIFLNSDVEMLNNRSATLRCSWSSKLTPHLHR